MNYSRASYRYILDNTVDLTRPIRDYHIVAQNKFPKNSNISHAIRIPIQNTKQLIRCKGQSYSILDSDQSLAETGCQLVIRLNGRWKADPLGLNLTNTQPSQVPEAMRRCGWLLTPFGYLDRDRFLYYTYQYQQDMQNHPEEDASSIWTFEKYFHKTTPTD